MTVVYRPPSMSNIEAFYDNLSDLLDQLGDVIDGDRFVCCGDFNCSGDDPKSVSTELQTVFDAHGLQQLVQSPTRRTVNKSSLSDGPGRRPLKHKTRRASYCSVVARGV